MTNTICPLLDSNHECKNMCLTLCVEGNLFWKVKVIVNTDGITAMEINKYPEPNHLDYKHKNQFGELVFRSDYEKNLYADNWEIWHEAEKNLRTFEISGIENGNIKVNPESVYGFKVRIEPNSVHNAEMLPNGKIKIIHP